MPEKRFERSPLLASVFLVLSLVPLSMVSADTDSVAKGTPLLMGEIYRSHGETTGRVQHFELEVPGPGLVSVDVVTPGYAPVEPLLSLPEGARERVDFELWHRSPGRFVLLTHTSQVLRFGLSAQDDRWPLETYQIRSGFMALAKGCSPEGEDCEEIEIEPNPLGNEGVGSFCPLDPLDDHGDTLGCATSLDLGGSRVAASLANGWGDDTDVFAIVLPETKDLGPYALRTVRVETRGVVDTFGSLYDGRGLPIGRDDDGGSGRGFRLVRSLPPGIYFIRVEGREGAEGRYVLTFDVDTP